MNIRLMNCQNREFLYALYSRIFMIEANEELLELIESEDIKEFFPNMSDWEIYKTLPREQIINEHLNVDFTDISLLHLVPYETFYIREDAMIESGGDNSVIAFYERFEFVVEKDKARIVSPDHIAVEMEFLYKLISAEKDALNDGNLKIADELRDLQIEFLEKHLLKWAPLYLIGVKNEAQTPFYHDSAMTAMDFLLGDYEYLKESLND